MPEETTQTATRVVRKNYFRSDIFFLGMAGDLGVGGVGLYAMVFEVFFGWCFIEIPWPDWQFYYLVGVQNVPPILAALYMLVVIGAATTYALFWRRLLFRVEQLQSVSIGIVTAYLASTALAFSMLPASLGELYAIWLWSITGIPSKFWGIFGVLPLTGANIGAFVGRTVMIRHWTRSRRLVVETVYRRWRMVKSRRLLLVRV
jgi:hypothetical protein